MRVLAVDDDPIILELLEVSLHQSGFCDLVTAASAEDALEIIEAQSQSFDCFLLDIVMPGKDGIELCADIRAMTAYRQTPIIMITALTGYEPLDRAFSAGATDYVRKPLNGLELGTRINLANMLNESLRREAAKDKMLRQQMLQPSPTQDAPSKVENVDGIVDILRLENTLLRLPEGFYAINVVAFDVISMDRSLQPNQTFETAIRFAAETISSALAGRRFIGAHAGDGVFIGFYSGRRVIGQVDLQSAIDEALGRLAPSGSLAIEVSIPATLKLISGRGALDALLAHARSRQQPDLAHKPDDKVPSKEVEQNLPAGD